MFLLSVPSFPFTSLDHKGMEVTCNVLISGGLPVLNQNLVEILDYDPRIIFTPDTKILVRVYLATDYYGRLAFQGINDEKLYSLSEISNYVLYGGYKVEQGKVKRDSRLLIHFSDGATTVTSFTCDKSIDIDEVVRKDEAAERIIVSDHDMKTRACIPAGALKNNTRMSIMRSDQFEDALAYDFQALNSSDSKPVQKFLQSVKIQIHYDVFGDNTIEKMNVRNDESVRQKLILSYYDGVQWIPVGGEVDTGSQTITAWVDHFSLYAITFDDGKDFRMGPNPFSPNNDGINDEVVFNVRNRLNQVLTVKIYSIVGRLIKELNVTTSPQPQFLEARWDGTDIRNKRVEDGIYIYQIKLGSRHFNGSVILAK
ncbi:MAG: gliding motility-associated C-terminal domain-containing protein [bacterium]|nr:gliding motility-associated C-terminal domain-containing protein [bacterium]